MAIEPPSKAGVETPIEIPVAKDRDGANDDKIKDDKIRERSHLIWIDEGRLDGRDVDHWIRAKWELEREPNP
jgi:hypothetical protein